MSQGAFKLELINWLSRINDKDTLRFLKSVMVSNIGTGDRGDKLIQEQANRD
jgi:hypothetical protein